MFMQSTNNSAPLEGAALSETHESNDKDDSMSSASSSNTSVKKPSLKVKISKRPSMKIDSDYIDEGSSDSSVKVVKKQRTPRKNKRPIHRFKNPTPPLSDSESPSKRKNQTSRKRFKKTPTPPSTESESDLEEEDDDLSDYGTKKKPQKRKSPKKTPTKKNDRLQYLGDFKNQKNVTPEKLNQRVELLQKTIKSQRAAIKVLKQSKRRLTTRVEKLEKTLSEEKKKRKTEPANQEDSKKKKKKGGGDEQKNTLTKLGNEILKRASQHSKAEYSEELKNFASLLYFYSPRAYTYVRSVFNTSLPHPSTLRKWIHKEEGDDEEGEKPAEGTVAETTTSIATNNTVVTNPDSPPRLNDIVAQHPPQIQFSDTELTLEAVVDSPPVVAGPSEPSRCTNPFAEVDANLETPKTYMFQTL